MRVSSLAAGTILEEVIRWIDSAFAGLTPVKETKAGLLYPLMNKFDVLMLHSMCCIM
jgi:hypothetical protein